jgi:ribose transport system substrate-binding protein
MFVRCLAALFVLSLAAGCRDAGSSPAAGQDGAKKYRIAVIPKGTTHEFWKSVHAGAQNAADELGNVEILWKGPQLENDRSGQIAVVRNFITSRVDGIVLAPLDSQALVEYVDEAVDEGVPVVIFDSALDDESRIVSYVATDNYEGGALAARRLAETLDGRGNVILLRYNPGSESTEQREQGFLDALEREFPEVRVISSSEYSGTTPEESLRKATQVLSRFREADGIFAVCEPNAAGTLRALEELELAGRVRFVAFDPNADLIRGLAEGRVDGIVLQDPVKMGYEAVKAIVRHLEGEPNPPRITTGEYVATPENMDGPRMRELLRPQQYGE